MKNMYEENVNVDNDFDENFYENAENEFDEIGENEPMDEYVPEEPFFENSSTAAAPMPRLAPVISTT